MKVSTKILVSNLFSIVGLFGLLAYLWTARENAGFELAAGAVIAIIGLAATFWTIGSTVQPIRRIVAGLSGGADQTASASRQVSSASHSLAEGASQQAAGLEETSSSLEEMASMTKQNADHAHQAKTMTSEALHIVENVNSHMGQMAAAIGEITHSSEETSNIIKTIDEIAFQTNLLALNAAVEAARAGEAGAGFAVVADEVRNLAMRASEAAKNTSHLLENTIKSVQRGNELTLATQEAFNKNVEISGKISKLIDEIAVASQEQAQGIGQVNRAVAEMDRVVQENAANAETSASAAEEMHAQAGQMSRFIRQLEDLIGGTGSGRREGKGLPGSEKNPEIADLRFSVPKNISSGKKERKGNKPSVSAPGKRPERRSGATTVPNPDEGRFKEF